MSERIRARIFYGWVVLGACFVISMVSGSLFYSRGVFLPAMSDEFGGSRFAVALAFTIAHAGGALSAPFIGRALDLWSARRILLMGTVLVSVGYFLASLAPSILVIYAVFGLILSVGWASISSFSTSKVVVRWFKRRRGLALSLDVAGASVAGIFIPPIAAWLLLNFGWRGGYVILGVVVVIILVPIILLFIKDPSETGDTTDGICAPSPSAGVASPVGEDEKFWSTRELLRSPSFWGIVILFSGMVCVFQGLGLHLYGHLEDSGMGAYEASIVLSVMAALIASGKPLLGWLADLLGPRMSILISLVCQMIGIILFSLAHEKSAFLIAAVIYGFGLSGMAPLRNMALASAFGSQSYGSAYGLMQPLSLPIVLLASPIAGFVYDELGSYVLAFQIFLVILLVTAPMLYFIKSDDRAEQEVAVRV
ncbi:MFS transporter [Kineobactrum sediminis]|uniref:MFS transporter n=1 Tax=Kineobactrum sediminis TaxID=1905677 RepID=UPI00138FA099|nr:MFS transporter [Kineobactrum sediminis]